jgi:hypothetical protein
MIFQGTVSPGGILEPDHPELYSDLLKGRLANCRVQLDIDRREAKQSLSQKLTTGSTGLLDVPGRHWAFSRRMSSSHPLLALFCVSACTTP